MINTFGLVLTIIILAVLGIIGFFAGQISRVCYDVLPCDEGLPEAPVFRIKNFKKRLSILFGVPMMILLPILFWFLGLSIEFFIFALLFVALLAIIPVDYKHYIIPDKLNLFIIVLGIIYIAIFFLLSQPELAFNHIMGGLLGGSIFLALALISLLILRKEGMGFGDIKLMFGLGLIFGVKGILVLTLIAFSIGAIACIFCIITRIKKVTDYIPFGPYICIASVILMFIPAGFFVDWYLKLLV